MRCRDFSVLLAAVAVAAATSLAPNATAQGDPNNAAGLYLSVFDRYSAIPEADWEPIWAYFPDPSQAPPDGLRTVLARYKPILADLQRAASKRTVDWKLDYAKGFEMLLPHLAPMRGLSRLQAAQVVLDFHDGRTAEAADGIATLYRLAAHASTDRTLISSLVGQAIYAKADELAKLGLDHRAFEGVSAQRLHRGHVALELDDPFRVMDAIAMEQELAATWLEAELGTAEARADMSTVEWLQVDEEQQGAFTAMTDADFAAELGSYDALMDLVAVAFANPDDAVAMEELKALEARTQAGEFGVIAQTVMPAFTKVLERTRLMEAKVDANAELFRGLAQGLEDPFEHANAVPFYIAAVEKLDELAGAAPGSLEALRMRDAGAELGPEDAEALAELMADADAVLDIVREGTLQERCDFSYLHRWNRVRLCPPYVAGLRDVVRVLHERVRIALDAGEPMVASERLGLGYRLVAHLGLDNHILLSTLAHDALLRHGMLAERLLAVLPPEAPERDRLFRAANAIGRGDPFGYVASVQQLRLMVSSLPYFWGMDEGRAAFRMAVDAWTPDELVVVAASYDALVRQGVITDEREREVARAAEPADLARVADLFDPAQLAAVVRHAAELHDRLRAADPAPFAGRVIPMPIAIELRQARARSDVRSEMARLRLRTREEAREAHEHAAGEDGG